MKLALLGADDDSLALLRAALERGHELVAALDSDARAADWRPLAPAARSDEPWESLVLGSLADAVIVGRGGEPSRDPAVPPLAERRAEQLRKLAQAATPLLVVCPACEAIVGFEVEMIRRDAGGRIVPYVPGADHPALARLQTIVTAGEQSPVGRIEQITLVREQAARGRDAVLVQAARDAALLRPLLGSIRSVTATSTAVQHGRDPLGPKPKEPPSLANLSMHLGGDEGRAARWWIAPPIRGDRGQLALIGPAGQVALEMPAGGPWTISDQAESDGAVLPAVDSDAARGWRRFEQALADPADPDDAAWLQACRDQEVAEAVDRSLARGRTIELYNEEHTEAESFKGVMAMGGCLLLVAALALLLLVAVVEGLQLPVRGWRLWRLWPLYLLVPFALFLALQALQIFVKPAASPAGKRGDAAEAR